LSTEKSEMEIKPILLLHRYLFSLFCLIPWVLGLVSEASDLSFLFSRLVVSGVGGPGLLVVVAPDRYLLVSVLSSHLLLLRQMPLLPGALLLSPRLWVHTSFTSTSPFPLSHKWACSSFRKMKVNQTEWKDCKNDEVVSVFLLLVIYYYS